jgi:hypothetical protein
MPLIKPEWMPDCRMDRIILHHTGGAHAASSLDKAHYHFLVEGNGNILRGDQPVCANADPIRGEYAAHTARLNTGSIGVAACAMLNATPRDGGRHPILPLQFTLMCEVAAELCRRYRIAVSPTTVLAHGEVDTNLGAYKTPGKWDPLFLPFLPTLTPREVGEHWRGRIREALRRQAEPASDEPIQAVQAAVMGFPMSAFLQDGAAWVPVRKASEALGYAVLAYVLPSGNKPGVAVVGKAGTEATTGIPLSAELNGGTLYVKARSLATALNRQVSWDPSSRKVSIF